MIEPSPCQSDARVQAPDFEGSPRQSGEQGGDRRDRPGHCPGPLPRPAGYSRPPARKPPSGARAWRNILGDQQSWEPRGRPCPALPGRSRRHLLRRGAGPATGGARTPWKGGVRGIGAERVPGVDRAGYTQLPLPPSSKQPLPRRGRHGNQMGVAEPVWGDRRRAPPQRLKRRGARLMPPPHTADAGVLTTSPLSGSAP